MHFCSLGGLKLRETKCVGLIKPKPGEHDNIDGFLWIVTYSTTYVSIFMYVKHYRLKNEISSTETFPVL